MGSAAHEPLNFAAELDAHRAWQRRLRNVIQGDQADQANLATARDAAACALGRWLSGEGRLRYGSRPEFEVLRVRHDTFHVQVAQVLELALAGERVRAQRVFLGAFAAASADLLATLESFGSSLPAPEPETAGELIWEDLTGY